ncbi:hypothetical protein [Maribacter sp. LLG6340-A2]|uniref:hypothetical protein n=1 Tax=Maribacter sp. LLG6340-A2 TaxID=3160834 RepID=UPI00386DF5F5
MKKAICNTLDIKGHFTSSNVFELQDKIEYALHTNDILTLNLKQLVEVDLVCAFMLFICIVKANKKNKEIKLQNLENNAIKEVFQMIGLNRYLGTI